jgi:hypothetical protein
MNIAFVQLMPNPGLRCNEPRYPLCHRVPVQTDDPAFVFVKQINDAWWQDRAAERWVHGTERLHLDVDKVKSLILVQVLQEGLQPGPGNGLFALADSRAFCGRIEDLALCCKAEALADQLTKSRSAGALAGDDHGIGQVWRSRFGVGVTPSIVRNPSDQIQISCRARNRQRQIALAISGKVTFVTVVWPGQ